MSLVPVLDLLASYGRPVRRGDSVAMIAAVSGILDEVSAKLDEEVERWESYRTEWWEGFLQEFTEGWEELDQNMSYLQTAANEIGEKQAEFEWTLAVLAYAFDILTTLVTSNLIVTPVIAALADLRATVDSLHGQHFFREVLARWANVPPLTFRRNGRRCVVGKDGWRGYRVAVRHLIRDAIHAVDAMDAPESAKEAARDDLDDLL